MDRICGNSFFEKSIKWTSQGPKPGQFSHEMPKNRVVGTWKMQMTWNFYIMLYCNYGVPNMLQSIFWNSNKCPNERRKLDEGRIRGSFVVCRDCHDSHKIILFNHCVGLILITFYKLLWNVIWNFFELSIKFKLKYGGHQLWDEKKHKI